MIKIIISLQSNRYAFNRLIDMYNIKDINKDDEFLITEKKIYHIADRIEDDHWFRSLDDIKIIKLVYREYLRVRLNCRIAGNVELTL